MPAVDVSLGGLSRRKAARSALACMHSLTVGCNDNDAAAGGYLPYLRISSSRPTRTRRTRHGAHEGTQAASAPGVTVADHATMQGVSAQRGLLQRAEVAGLDCQDLLKRAERVCYPAEVTQRGAS
jgi:hypothetical protein